MRAELIAIDPASYFLDSALAHDIDHDLERTGTSHLCSMESPLAITEFCAACGHEDLDLVCLSVPSDHRLDLPAISRLGIRHGAPALAQAMSEALASGRRLRLVIEH